MTKKYSVQEKIWLYPGKAGWYFLTIPTEISQNIDFYFSVNKKGWGSLPVSVTIGKTTWRTSIFPDKKTHTYLLPLKAEVRKKENLKEDDQVSLALEIIG